MEIIVLHVLALIWKSGASIERLPNGELQLNNAKVVPADVLKAAEPIFSSIDSYLKSVEGMGNIDMTAWKMVVALNGWQQNETINNFLNNDEEGLSLFFDYQTELAKNGWTDIYTDWREYENEQTAALKAKIYERAIAFAKSHAHQLA